jgi:Fe-S cluster biogenesis protein NfuA
MTPDAVAKTEQRILEVLEVVRPYLQQDGGDVEFVSWVPDDHIVSIRFLGACATCSLNIMTLQAGIQAMMKEEIPDVHRVNMVRC